MSISKTELTIGIVGAGSFAGFAAKAFLKVPGIKVIAVTDTHSPVARQLANELNAKAHPDYETLLSDSRFTLPPHLFYIIHNQRWPCWPASM